MFAVLRQAHDMLAATSFSVVRTSELLDFDLDAYAQKYEDTRDAYLEVCLFNVMTYKLMHNARACEPLSLLISTWLSIHRSMTTRVRLVVCMHICDIAKERLILSLFLDFRIDDRLVGAACVRIRRVPCAVLCSFPLRWIRSIT